MLIANATLDEISLQLEEDYKSIVSKFDIATRKILDESLDSPQRVTLYGRNTTPFSVEASPINKVFLAHALIECPDIYVQAEISEKAGKLYKTQNGITVELAPDFYVCRHGSKPPIVDIIDGFDLTNFRGKQKAIADVLNIGEYNHLDFLEHIDFARECDPEKHKYADDRVSLAKSFAKAFYDQEPQPKINNATKRLDYLFVKDDVYLDSKYLTGGHDKDLFGVNIVLEERPIEMLSTAQQDSEND